MSGQGKFVCGRKLAAGQNCLVAGVMAILAFGSSGAEAGVAVEVQPGGGADGGVVVVVDANGASVGEILTALGETGGVHFRASVDLGRTVSGTYKGTVQQVVSRVLEGYNFTLQVSDNRVEAVIIGLAGSTAAAGQATTAVAAATAADAATPGTPAEPAPLNADTANRGATTSVRRGTPRRQANSAAANVASQLQTAAQLQVMNAATAPPAPATPANPPSAADMAALTQQARSQLDALVTSLQSVKP